MGASSSPTPTSSSSGTSLRGLLGCPAPVHVPRHAAQAGISNEEAKKQLLAEKEPSLQFTTPEELGELAVFFCSAAGQNVRGVAWNMDGGWAAQ